jgi:acyl-CoA thioester hydrolase
MRFELPQARKLVHTSTIPIRWGDMDTMGHVNNTIYFRYFETVRLDWLESLGLSLRPTEEGLIMANGFCNFIRPLKFPGDVIAKHFVANPGRSSFDTFVTLERRDEPGVFYADGGATLAWVDFVRGKSLPMPDWLRAHMV